MRCRVRCADRRSGADIDRAPVVDGSVNTAASGSCAQVHVDHAIVHQRAVGDVEADVSHIGPGIEHDDLSVVRAPVGGGQVRIGGKPFQSKSRLCGIYSELKDMDRPGQIDDILVWQVNDNLIIRAGLVIQIPVARVPPRSSIALAGPADHVGPDRAGQDGDNQARTHNYCLQCT